MVKQNAKKGLSPYIFKQNGTAKAQKKKKKKTLNKYLISG